MTDPFVLAGFTMSTVSHGNFGLWRHPDDTTASYTDVRYWVELAKLLEPAASTCCSSPTRSANSTSMAGMPTRR
jgi:hypothetical protein